MDSCWMVDLQRIASTPRVSAPPGFVQDVAVTSARASYVLKCDGGIALRHHKTGYTFRSWPAKTHVLFSPTDDNVVLVNGVAELIVPFERKKSV